MKSIAAEAFLLLGTLCALAASSAGALERADASADENPAVLALLEAADEDLDAGRPDDAAIVIERALRIEPRNPVVWLYLGLARFDQGNYAQAEAMAAKSHTLASSDRSLRTRNVGLMASAQRAAGKPVSVPSEEPRPSTWERLFAHEVEPAAAYADSGDGAERADDAPRRSWPAGGAAPRTDRAAPSRDWRRASAAYAERLRERAAAWQDQRSERPRSVIVFDGHQYRRYVFGGDDRRHR
jgi:tetratricopeptide (TPR) repeat protein